MKRLIYVSAVLQALLLSQPARADRPLVCWMRLDGAIGPTSAEFFDRAVTRAEEGGAACLVVEMDTPGGLDAAMRRMIKRIQSADVPVVVYVSPSGSRAASAGAFIVLSAHIAAMAPGTNIGAAHPVQLGGAIPDTTVNAKAVNDAAAYIRSLAEKQNRNADWAEQAVRESVSITAQDALAQNVIDLVAATSSALLDSLDGRQVAVAADMRKLRTADARVEDIRMGFRERLLSSISDPNIAYILMILGIYGLMFEFYNPGAIVPGVIGSICLILAFYALQTLPLNFAGLLLILLAIVLFILEIKVPSYGGLTIGGVCALALGSTMLFDTPGNLFRISWTVILPTVVATALFFTFSVGMGIRAQRLRPRGGLDDLIGQTGVARTDIGADGTVFVAGEYWQAVCDGQVRTGQNVRVVKIVGSTLKVEAVQD